MELRHLRYFIEVAEAENVSRAALKLHVSQPALSRQVRDLESELGFALLLRSAKSVRLTDAGRVFLEEARGVLRRAEEAVDKARQAAAGSGGELHVGYAPSLTSRILPPSIRAFQAEHRSVRVKLHDLSTEEMLTGLREAELQITFGVRPPPAMLRGVVFENLSRDALRLAVPPEHPLAKKQTLPLAEAAKLPLIAYSRKEYPEYYQMLTALFRKIQQKPRVVEEHDSVSSLIAAVEAGSGVALVPESISCTAGPRLILIPLTPSPEPLIIGATWPKGGLAPLAERFLQHARKAATQQLPRRVPAAV